MSNTQTNVQAHQQASENFETLTEADACSVQSNCSALFTGKTLKERVWEWLNCDPDVPWWGWIYIIGSLIIAALAMAMLP